MIFGLGLGFLIGKMIFKTNHTQLEWDELKKQNTISETKLTELELRYKDILQKKEELEKIYQETLTQKISIESDYKNTLANFDVQRKEWEESKKTIAQDFSNLAKTILLENSERLQNHSLITLENFLKPFKENLLKFEQKLEATQKEQAEQSISLRTEIRNLAEMNKTMSQEAQDLTRALKGESKVRGTWGERILERVLEASGLEKGIHYRTQETLKDEDNQTKRPDVILELPENKQLIIDSKVSLVAYENYCNAETKEERQKYLKEHITSLEKHAKTLAEKNYQTVNEINSFDFVLMFVPIENALNIVLQEKTDFFQYFFSRNVIPVTSLTLLFTLKMIHNLWKLENQNANAKEIAKEEGLLYDKFVDFTKDLSSIGNYLDKTQKSYEDAMKKLKEGRGNLISRADKLKKLGADTTKELEFSSLEVDKLE
ncbi:MAG: DNA recombination protein RmuC [Leptospiraceae bacterium]|nr:DNA recombination protein RmuC [Leptospiraceae bacterium]